MPHNAWSQGIFAAAFPGLPGQRLLPPDHYRTNVYSITCDTPKAVAEIQEIPGGAGLPGRGEPYPGASISSDRTPAWARESSDAARRRRDPARQGQEPGHGGDPDAERATAGAAHLDRRRRRARPGQYRTAAAAVEEHRPRSAHHRADPQR